MRAFRNFDFLIFSTFLILIFFGFILIYSTTRTPQAETQDTYFFLKRQIIWFAIGTIFFFIIILTDYTLFHPMSKYIYILNIVMLVATLLFGKVVGGSQRWISVGGFQIQPSEFAKLAIIITLSSFFANNQENVKSFKTLFISLCHVFVPFVLIFKQPDLGTSLVLLFIWFFISLSAGVSVKQLFFLGIAGIGFLPIAFHFLKDYQKKRLITFLDPSVDPLGSGYHIIQSKIAIGSGGIFGKGLCGGSQSQLNFIPGQHTDFIFSSLGEEFGFIGCVFVLILFFILVQRGLTIASVAKDNFGKYVSVGVVSLFMFHIFVNIGMTVGIMPVVGLPLPFLSYGGSNLLLNMIAVSLLLSIKLRKEKIRF